MKTNLTTEKIKAANKKALMKFGEKLVKRVKDSGLKHGHIAEAVQATDETFSRFMTLKPDYVTTRLCRAIDEYLNKKSL
jgi:hypothetical protein